MAAFLLGGLAHADCSTADSVAIARVYGEWVGAESARAADDATNRKQDLGRLETMRKLVREGSACTADDQYFASVVLLGSHEFEDIDLAYQTAGHALSGGHPDALPLVAAALDTTLVAQGLPQKYGTQTREVAGSPCLIEISSELTDVQRQQYGQPPVEERYRQFLDEHGHPEVEATAKGLRKAGLSCPAVSWATGKTMARASNSSKVKDRAQGEAGGIEFGELLEDAGITPTGALLLHPLFAQSSYGLPGPVDVKVRLLGLVFLANFGAEVGIVQTEQVRVSIEGEFMSTWRVPLTAGAGFLRTSFGRRTALNLSAGLYGDNMTKIPALQFSLGLDAPLSGDSMIRTSAGSVLVNLESLGDVHGEVTWVKAVGQSFRVQLGAGVYYTESRRYQTWVGAVDAGLKVFPYPTATLWWRI